MSRSIFRTFGRYQLLASETSEAEGVKGFGDFSEREDWNVAPLKGFQAAAYGFLITVGHSHALINAISRSLDVQMVNLRMANHPSDFLSVSTCSIGMIPPALRPDPTKWHPIQRFHATIATHWVQVTWFHAERWVVQEWRTKYPKIFWQFHWGTWVYTR